MVGLAVGLLIGLMTGLRTNAADRLALGQDARRVIHDDLVAALTAGLMVGLAVGLPCGLLGGLTAGLNFGLTYGLLVGLLAGLTAGRHATASLLFAFTDIFPARPVQFLEWPATPGFCASPASPTSADTTAISSGWAQALLIEVSRRLWMRKPTDDLEPRLGRC
jgi:hypothetical protein